MRDGKNTKKWALSREKGLISADKVRDITTISPTASAGQAVRLMREKALRRLPVVDNETGRVVGVLSIGDIAIERDRRSLLGDISAAPGNV